MKAAQIAKYAFLAIFFSVAALVFSVNTWAASGNMQICHPDTSCTIGEFLYNDSYVPIIDATCSITSRYPDGSLFLNAVAMVPAAQSDGWYSHTFTAPATSGLYRTEVKCTTDGETLALDKSFEVKQESTLTSNDVSSAVWDADRNSYSNSGSFGGALQNTVPASADIAASVWGYSGRTLSSFGTLIADIWANATRTLTGTGLDSGKLATQSDVSSAKDEATSAKNDIAAVKSDVSSIKDTVGKINTTTTTINNVSNVQNVTNEISNIQNITNETRNLLEQVINKPIIENGLESDNSTIIDFELQSKLEKSTSLASQMLINSNYLKSKINLISAKGDTLDTVKLRNSIDSLLVLIGSQSDDENKNSLFGSVNYIKKQWDFEVVSLLYNHSQKLSMQLSAISQGLQDGGKLASVSKQISQINLTVDQLIDQIGNPDDSVNKNTLFASLKEKKELSQVLNRNSGEINGLLAKWNYDPKSAQEKADKDIYKKVSDMSKQITAVNQLPKVNNLLTVQAVNKMTQKDLMNKTLSLRGIVEANKQFVVLGSSRPFGSLWLEEGSMVFKTLITNPSSKVSQTVPLKYYLPKEVTKESIIKTDDGLSISYDMDKDQYFVKGEFVLGPKESKTISVTVDDSIFHVQDAEIASIRKHAEELSKPLQNTSYFAQGVTLKTDINASLDRIEVLQKEGITPEAKIKAFRNSQIEYKAAKEKLEKMQELASAAGSVGTLFGFVGGAQILAVWGLVIIFIAGFVFLSLYMRTIKNNGQNTESKIRKPLSLIDEESAEYYNPDDKTEEDFYPKRHKVRPLVFSIIVLVGGLISLSMLYAAFNVRQSIVSNKEKLTYQTTSKKDLTDDQKSDSTVLGSDTQKEAAVSGKEATIFVPENSLVNVFRGPSLTSAILAGLEAPQKAVELKQQDNWLKVSFTGTDGKVLTGWVDQDFVENTAQNQQEEDMQKPQGGVLNNQTSVTIADTPTGFLRVRQSPAGLEITKIYPGDEYPSIRQQSGWVQIVLSDGTLGWVSSRYIN